LINYNYNRLDNLGNLASEDDLILDIKVQRGNHKTSKSHLPQMVDLSNQNSFNKLDVRKTRDLPMLSNNIHKFHNQLNKGSGSKSKRKKYFII